MITYIVKLYNPDKDQTETTEQRCDHMLIRGDLVAFYRTRDSENTLSMMCRGVVDLPYLVLHSREIESMMLKREG